MISKLVSEFATLQKDEQQREKERLRELEQELARSAEDEGRDTPPAFGSHGLPSGDDLSEGRRDSAGTPNSDLAARLQETERLLARKVKQVAALEERAKAADKGRKELTARAAEAARLQRIVEELTAAQAEERGRVEDLTRRLAAATETAGTEASGRAEELQRTYELLSQTEARLNAAEAALAAAGAERDAARTTAALEAATAAAQRAEAAAATDKVQALEAALREAHAAAAAPALQELRRDLEERTRHHQQELARLHEAHRAAEAEWRRQTEAAEGRCAELLEAERGRQEAGRIIEVRTAEPTAEEVQAVALETWCLRVVIGFVVCSVLMYLFLRRVVPHTTICMRDMAAPPPAS